MLQGGVEIREAEEHFVDEEENLEEGETLIRANQGYSRMARVSRVSAHLVGSSASVQSSRESMPQTPAAAQCGDCSITFFGK